MPAAPPPCVSVVVPVYNGAAYLEGAVASVLEQSFGDWEAILVDDASQDESAQIAARLAAEHPGRVVALALEHNVGVAGARNAGIAAARGELVALLDQDDLLLPAFLERSVALHDAARASGRHIGVVAVNALIATEDGPTGETFAERFWWSDRIDLDGMIARNLVLARALVSRTAIREAGGFSPDCRASDDYDLWLRLLELGWEVATTREPLAVYRIHARAQSRDHRLMAEGTLVACERALARGRLTGPQRRAVRTRMRHVRALRERALVREAAAQGRPVRAAGRAVRAAPYGAVAFAQAPQRWAEWARDLARPHTTDS